MYLTWSDKGLLAGGFQQNPFLYPNLSPEIPVFDHIGARHSSLSSANNLKLDMDLNMDMHLSLVESIGSFEPKCPTRA